MELKKYIKCLPHLLLTVLIGLTSFSAQAADIQGIAGYTLGDVLNKESILNEKQAEDGAIVYTVKPLQPVPQVDILNVRITPTRQIHRISAYTSKLGAAQCQTEMVALRKQTEKRLPALGYYAMDQSEMFYQDDRTYTLECIKFDGGIRLRQEYSDDKLAK